MMFYESVKFKADHIAAIEHLREFEVNLLYRIAVTMVMMIE